MTKFTKIAGIVAVAATGGFSLAATAATPSAAADADKPTLVVKFSAASLATDEGARILYRRLVAASESVCPAPASTFPHITDFIKECRANALAGAVQQIGNARLAALYANSGRNG